MPYGGQLRKSAAAILRPVGRAIISLRPATWRAVSAIKPATCSRRCVSRVQHCRKSHRDSQNRGVRVLNAAHGAPLLLRRQFVAHGQRAMVGMVGGQPSSGRSRVSVNSAPVAARQSICGSPPAGWKSDPRCCRAACVVGMRRIGARDGAARRVHCVIMCGYCGDMAAISARPNSDRCGPPAGC